MFRLFTFLNLSLDTYVYSYKYHIQIYNKNLKQNYYSPFDLIGHAYRKTFKLIINLNRFLTNDSSKIAQIS